MKKNSELEKYFYVDDSPIHGKGLFARKKLKKEQFLGTYHGPKTKENDMHVLWVEEEEGKWIGKDGKNMLRYLNHSNKPCAEFYPDTDFLHKCFHANIPITLGSDAHEANQIGQYFGKAKELLKSIGYRKIATFDRRRKQMEVF